MTDRPLLLGELGEGLANVKESSSQEFKELNLPRKALVPSPCPKGEGTLALITQACHRSQIPRDACNF
jgi:hypothetical protein